MARSASASTAHRSRPSLVGRALVWLIVVGLLVNWGLSYYIQSMKDQNFSIIPIELRGQCFEGALGGAGCGAVQTSTYSATFGVSNPHYGYVAFPVLALLVIATAWATVRMRSLAPLLAKGAFFGLLVGSAFSIWLLYVQYFLLHTTCKYCLVVDAIMLLTTVLFAWRFHRELSA